MSERQKVLVDMDGVLAGFDEEVQACLDERHPEIERQPRVNYYISDDYPEHGLLVRAISNEPGFFARLPLISNAKKGLQRIIDLGYEPQICSAPLTANPTCKAEKLQWLERVIVPHFGRQILETAAITKNKHAVPGLALIDDRLALAGTSEAEWTQIIFDQPWNQGQPGFRLHGWLDKNLSVFLDQLSGTIGG